MVGGVKALILLLVVVCVGCGGGKHHVSLVQGKVATLERTWKEVYNRAAKQKDVKQRIKDKAAAYKMFHTELSNIDISNCPNDYKQAFEEHASVVGLLSEAWNKYELKSVAEALVLEKERVSAGEHMNRIYHDHIN